MSAESPLDPIPHGWETEAETLRATIAARDAKIAELKAESANDCRTHEDAAADLREQLAEQTALKLEWQLRARQFEGALAMAKAGLTEILDLAVDEAWCVADETLQSIKLSGGGV